MKSRITSVFLLFATLWVFVVARSAYLQIIPNQRLASLQKRQFETTVTLQSRRGAIVDRNGQELAVSIRTDSFFADPLLIENPKKSARKIAKILKFNADTIAQKILHNKSKRFVWIQRHLDPKMKAELSQLKLKGFGFVPESKRIYPNGGLLASTLGFVGQEGQGLEGLEARFDNVLRKRSRQVSLPRDARGRPLINNGQFFNENPDGSDLELTIDRDMEFMLERELALTVEKHQAASAVGLVMDAKTSEILAMAQVPSFNPNAPTASPAESRRNRVVTDAFEPGSVMKTFIAAGAMSDQMIQPNSRFNCEGGKIKIGGRLIREAESHENFQILSVSEILAFSSNVGMTKIAFQHGAQAVYRSLLKFGFGERTGVDLAGESKGIVHTPPWRPHHFANIAFGHGLTATPLQIASAYTAIANGGVLKTPVLVRSIRDIETGETKQFTSQVIRRVLSQSDAEKVTLMLTGVTATGGTGVRARVAGYPVAGKTGTAQKVRSDGRGYIEGGYISSFAGFVPANDPRFVIYITVDSPKKNYYAAATSAPVFANIARFALRKAMVAPVLISEKNLVPKDVVAKAKLAEAPQPDDQGQVPNLLGLSLREAYQRLGAQDVSLKAIGEGWIVRTEPAANEAYAPGRKLTLFLESKH